MKKYLLTPLFIFLFFTVSVHIAEAQWVLYKADVLPDAFTESPFVIPTPAGTYTNTIVDDPEIEGNKLLYMTTADNSSNFLWRRNYGTSPSRENLTVVVRAKAKAESSANMVFEMDIEWGGTRCRMFILTNGNYRREVPSPSSTASMGGINVYNWNIYRFTKSGGQVNLYINESEVPVFSETTASSVSNHHFRIGDLWGSGHINTEIDWIAWDPEGAYSPTQAQLPSGLTGVGDPQLSTEAEILTFKLPGQISDETINSENGTIDISVPQGTDLTSVVPSTVTISANATINPATNVAQDFSNGNEVTYTLTAQDGTTTKEWKVKVTEVASSEKEILSFKLTDSQIGDAVINSTNRTVTVSVPSGEDLSSVVPVTFTISDYASVNPTATSTQNFTSPVVYTVTAQDNSTKEWTVTANVVEPEELYFNYQAEDALFTGKSDNQHAGYTGTGFIDFLSSGDNYIIFTVCQEQAGSRTAKFRYSLGNDEVRTASLYVNDQFISLVEFPPTATFTEWAESSVVVPLVAGISNVKLTWAETDGPNLDKLSLGGTQCQSYTLMVSTTNSGTVTLSPWRAGNNYFEGETVTLLAENKPDLVFANWTDDLTGTENPAQVVMVSNKSITANFNTVNTYTLQVTVNGVGDVQLDPPGGQYAEGTVVTLTASPVLGSTFQGWSGDLVGSTSPETITMTSNKSVTATFTSSDISLDFETPVGFASVVTGSGTYQYTTSTFYGPVTGGKNAEEVLTINGPADFDKLAKYLYNRNRAYKNASQSWGGTVAKAPLIIVLKEGVYPEGTTESSAWGNHMMTIQEQGDLTIIGQGNVVLNWGINVKRSWNILIRNITFQDYYDDAINIGEPETHHIWVDHCTFGHPTTRPSNTEHPDGGVDVKAGASYVTVSWNKFRNSWKTNLIGHSDSNGGEDLGKLKVTLFANHYYNSNSRNPRVRFGEVHVLNNLMEELTLYGIAASNQSQVYAENNFYLNTRWPMYADRSLDDFRAVYGNNTDGVFTSKTGNYACTALKAVGNEYDDSGLHVITAQINSSMLNPSGRSVKFDEHNTDNIFNPSTHYSYTPYAASVVRTIIPLYAGADKVDFFSEGPNNGIIEVTGTFTPFEHIVGNPSESQSYSVSATSISGSLTVTPPASFEVSVNQTNWFTNSNPLMIASVDGVVETTTIYVRLNANASGSYSGNIAHTASGASPVLKEISGSAANAAGTIPVGDWTIYEANQLPTAFSGSFQTSQQSGVFSNTIVADPDKEANNLLRMITTDNGDATNDNNQWRYNLSAGLQNITVVIKAKGIDSEKDLVFDIDLDHGGFRWSMRIRSNGMYSMAVPSGASGELGINPLQWNSYRFVKSGANVAVYLNENPAPIYTGTANSGTQNYFRFGDGWGTDAGVVKTMSTDIDWVLWDVSGAFSPAETRLPDHLASGEVTPPQPTISIAESLQGFSQVIGSPSDAQTYSVSGSNLTENITITPPAGYEISNDNGATWYSNTSPLVLTQAGGSVASTTIQVRLNAGSTGAHEGNITHTSAVASTVNVAVNGAASFADPVISVSGTLSAFTQTTGSPSAHQIYSVSGNNLAGNLTITPPANFELSANGGTIWFTSTSPLVLTPTDGNVATTEIRVRLNASLAGSYSGSIVHTSSGAASAELAVTGTTTGVLTPTITVEGTLTNFSQTIGSPFVIQTYTVSGNGLRSNVTITPPEKFEISGDKGYSWRTNNKPLILAPVNGEIPPVTISVRLNSPVVGEVSGSIIHETSGADAVAKAVAGVVDAVTGISLLGKEVEVSLSPNPVNDRLMLSRVGDYTTAHILIYSVTGVKITSHSIEYGQTDLTVETYGLEKGVYFIEYVSKQGRQVYRVIKL